MEVIEVTEREIEVIEVIERGPQGPAGPQQDINYEVVASARTLEAADLIAADTSGGAFTLTLPASPSNGDAIDIFDFSDTFDTNNLTIARNGSKIESLTEDLVCNVEGAYFTLIYTGATRGWQVLPRYGTSGGGGESTLTTQGDTLYRGVSSNSRLPIGTAGQVLKVNSGATAPEWGTISTAPSGPAGGGLTGTYPNPSLAAHTHVSANITDATSSATGNKIVIRDGGGAASFSDLILTGPVASLGTENFITIDDSGLLNNQSSNDARTIIGLGNVNNTSDANKPISTATQTALDLKAPLESPALTGTPTAPTASAGTNTTQVATTAFTLANRGDRYLTTSTTSESLTTGSKTFVVQSGLSYTATQDITIVADADPVNKHMHGVVTSYSGTTLVVDIQTVNQSGGPYTAWTINVGGLLSSEGALYSANNLSDVSNPATALTNIGGVPTSRSISAGTGLTGGGDFTANRTLAVSYGSSAGTACEGNDARLSDSRTPTAHAASHAAGRKAEFVGTVAGITNNVMLRADVAGTAGNSITLTFDGVDDIQTAIDDWNTANPSNTVSAIFGDLGQVPDNGETITLVGGAAAGSDAFKNINQNLGNLDAPEFLGIYIGAGATSATASGAAIISTNGGVGLAIENPEGNQVSMRWFSPATTGDGNHWGFGCDTLNTNENNFFIWDFINNRPALWTNGDTGNVVFGGEYAEGTLPAKVQVIGISPSTATLLGLDNKTAGAVAQKIRAAVSQSANLSEWLDSSGNLLLSVNSSGNLVLHDNVGGANTATFTASSQLTGNRSYNVPDASGTLALTSDIPANTIASTIVDAKGDLIVGTAADTVARLPVGATNGHVLTVDSAEASGMKWAAASGGIAGSTSTDNAIVRADSTANTVQSSDINIEDATTSTANNVTISNQHSGQTNSSLVLSPKGTGSLSASKPNGAASGGNARGANATDWQTLRTAATQVASGTGSVIIGGDRNTSSNVCTIAGGEGCTASATYSIALGRTNAATTGAANAVVGGQDNTATGAEAFIGGGGANSASASYTAILSGNYGLADRSGMLSQANGRFAATGDAQWIHMVLRAKTTTNSAVELLINNLRTTNGRLTCPSGKIISGIINIHGVKSDGTASAHYVRQFQVKNVGGTSSYPYTAATIGTDYASSTSITFNDPDTNGDALSVSVTGIASETWRWTAHISAVETAYGT